MNFTTMITCTSLHDYFLHNQEIVSEKIGYIYKLFDKFFFFFLMICAMIFRIFVTVKWMKLCTYQNIKLKYLILNKFNLFFPVISSHVQYILLIIGSVFTIKNFTYRCIQQNVPLFYHFKHIYMLYKNFPNLI